MRSARIKSIACAWALCSMLTAAAKAGSVEQPDLDTDAVQAISEKARQAATDMQIPGNKYSDSAKGKAREMVDFIYSDEYQNKVRMETERLKKTVFGPQFESELGKQVERQYPRSGRSREAGW